MEPFRVVRTGSVLELVLDTPDASVNVFGPPAAAQLDAVVASPPSGVDTLLLRSAKPGSFVNGAGLLYANAMRSVEGALAVSEPVRAVYERLAASPLRTIALVEGNCFGCGLELALACDVRIARDLPETELRMTEVTDYRFVPLFGGTWRLPRRVGVEAAAELLLDGARWDATTARARGLVDHVLAADASDGELAALVAESRGKESRAPVAPRRASTARRVPPSRAALWREVEGLLRDGVTRAPEDCRREEVAAFARSVTTRDAKQAMAFFFTRHAARAASFGSAQRSPPRVRLAVEASAGTAGVVAAWERRVLARAPSRGRPRVALSVLSDREARAGRVGLLFPRGVSVPFCEISARVSDAARARAIGEALAWLGVETVVTLGGGQHVARLLLERTRRALRRLVAAGASRERINRAFWEEGFADPFGAFRAWPEARARIAEPAVVERVVAVWEETLTEALARGLLAHASQGDVLVHELFEFPVELGSFGRWRSARRAAPEAAE